MFLRDTTETILCDECIPEINARAYVEYGEDIYQHHSVWYRLIRDIYPLVPNDLESRLGQFVLTKI